MASRVCDSRQLYRLAQDTPDNIADHPNSTAKDLSGQLNSAPKSTSRKVRRTGHQVQCAIRGTLESAAGHRQGIGFCH